MIVLKIYSGETSDKFTPCVGTATQMSCIMQRVAAKRLPFRVLYGHATSEEYRTFVRQECVERTSAALEDGRMTLLDTQLFHLRGCTLTGRSLLEVQDGVLREVYDTVKRYQDMERDVIVISDDDWGVTISVIGDRSMQRIDSTPDSIVGLT